MAALSWRDLADAVAKDPDLFIDERDRRRLLAFTRRLFPAYEDAPHIATLSRALEAAATTPGARLIVTMPPRHSKSLNVSEHLPAWYLGRRPDARIIAAAHTAQLAYTFSRRVRNKLADPRWPFPTVRTAGDKAAVQAWDIDGHRGGYVAVGVGGSPTGHGADLVLIDDPIRSAADADSATIRESLWEWYTGTLRTRLEPGGSMILTATRWHSDDLTGRLLAAQDAGGEAWTHLHMPAISDDGDALWPDRWPVDALERIRAAIGTRAFEAQYQGRPSPAEGGAFKRHWWRYWHLPGAPLPPVTVRGPGGTPVQIAPVPLPPTPDEALQSWDMTFRQTTGGSFVVGQVWWRVGANRYAIDQFRARVGFADTCLAVRTLAATHPEATIKLVENKANGDAVLDALRAEIPGLVAVNPEGGKESRAAAASGVAEAGNVYLPHPALAPWTESFVEEAAAFPAGATDDQVDAYSQAMARFAVSQGYGYSYLNGHQTRRNGHHATDAFGNDVADAFGRFAGWGRS